MGCWRKKALNAVVVMCAVMHVVTLLPHHHHGASRSLHIPFLTDVCSDTECSDCCDNSSVAYETFRNDCSGGICNALACGQQNATLSQPEKYNVKFHPKSSAETGNKHARTPDYSCCMMAGYLYRQSLPVKRPHFGIAVFTPLTVFYISAQNSPRGPDPVSV
jgi:hypothetical protein